MIVSLKILLLFAVLLLNTGLAISQTETNVSPSEHQLLWQISGNGLKKPSYLFGSYHTNDARVFKLSDSTYSALMNVDAIVLEADIYELFTEYDMRLKHSDLKFDSNGKAYTSSKGASKTKYGNEDGRPQFLDLYFQQLAYNMEKDFFVLETIQEQMEAFESLYERSAAQKNLQQLKVIQDNLLQVYLRGDINRLLVIIRKEMRQTKSAYERIIVKRNYNMADGIDTLCRQKSLFIAIGAGHLAGNEGVIQLLRQKGYHVRQVIASFAEKRTPAELALRKYNKCLYRDTNYNFSAVLGGKPIQDTVVSYYRLVYQEMGQGNTYVIEIESEYEFDVDLATYIGEIMDSPEEAKFEEVKHQDAIKAFKGIGYEYGAGLSWKKVFVYKNKLIRLICYGGNKFMNSNRPQSFFDQVKFD